MSALTPGVGKHTWAEVEARQRQLETALRDLFDWCSDTVPYFGEHWRGSRADEVYKRACAALGEKLMDDDIKPIDP